MNQKKSTGQLPIAPPVTYWFNTWPTLFKIGNMRRWSRQLPTWRSVFAQFYPSAAANSQRKFRSFGARNRRSLRVKSFWGTNWIYHGGTAMDQTRSFFQFRNVTEYDVFFWTVGWGEVGCGNSNFWKIPSENVAVSWDLEWAFLKALKAWNFDVYQDIRKMFQRRVLKN